MTISLLLLLICMPCVASIENTIYSALMSYNAPRTFKNQAESYFKNKIGNTGVISMSVAYRLIEKQELVIPFKYHQHKYILTIKPNNINMLYNKEF